MGVFIRTVIVTLIICIIYYIYIFVGKESFSPELKPNNTSIHKTATIKTVPKDIPNVQICLINSDNKPVIVKRNSNTVGLEYALKELLKGSIRSERLEGTYSEIPKGVKLLSFKDNGKAIYINLSHEFEEGGGAQSIQARLLQLVKTVNLYSNNKPIFLYIESKKVEYLGGEGVYVEQPLNEANLKF